uniref:(California timema) hypothetical protein n=1 Tax=Timema californicum TaxID=61474 RepID=A0A7R9J0J7_TIMCA|nr:unnamed protein product [Timema californicum]
MTGYLREWNTFNIACKGSYFFSFGYKRFQFVDETGNKNFFFFNFLRSLVRLRLFFGYYWLFIFVYSKTISSLVLSTSNSVVSSWAVVESKLCSGRFSTGLSTNSSGFKLIPSGFSLVLEPRRTGFNKIPSGCSGSLLNFFDLFLLWFFPFPGCLPQPDLFFRPRFDLLCGRFAVQRPVPRSATPRRRGFPLQRSLSRRTSPWRGGKFFPFLMNRSSRNCPRCLSTSSPRLHVCKVPEATYNMSVVTHAINASTILVIISRSINRHKEDIYFVCHGATNIRVLKHVTVKQDTKIMNQNTMKNSSGHDTHSRVGGVSKPAPAPPCPLETNAMFWLLGGGGGECDVIQGHTPHLKWRGGKWETGEKRGVTSWSYFKCRSPLRECRSHFLTGFGGHSWCVENMCASFDLPCRVGSSACKSSRVLLVGGSNEKHHVVAFVDHLHKDYNIHHLCLFESNTNRHVILMASKSHTWSGTNTWDIMDTDLGRHSPSTLSSPESVTEPMGLEATHLYTPSSSGKASEMRRVYTSPSFNIWKYLEGLITLSPFCHLMPYLGSGHLCKHTWLPRDLASEINGLPLLDGLAFEGLHYAGCFLRPGCRGLAGLFAHRGRLYGTLTVTPRLSRTVDGHTLIFAGVNGKCLDDQ